MPCEVCGLTPVEDLKMVFLTRILSARPSLKIRTYFGNQGPDKFWKKQQFRRFAWHFSRRSWNIYSLGIRVVNKALMYASQRGPERRQRCQEVFMSRIHAAALEHGLEGKAFQEGLIRSGIELDRKSLQDLAIYEPRTFQSLCKISREKLEAEGLLNVDWAVTDGVWQRGMIRK